MHWELNHKQDKTVGSEEFIRIFNCQPTQELVGKVIILSIEVLAHLIFSKLSLETQKEPDRDRIQRYNQFRRLELQKI